MRSRSKFILCLNLVLILFVYILLNKPTIRNTSIVILSPIQFDKNIITELENQQLQISKLRVEYEVLKNKIILTPQDIIILEKITELEASNQLLRGKAMVANVVINRAIQTNKSIAEIVNERGQFEPVSRGLMRRARVTPETKQAVNMAIYKDYTRGATYFMNPKISDKKSIRWFRETLDMTTSYKDHEYYKEIINK